MSTGFLVRDDRHDELQLSTGGLYSNSGTCQPVDASVIGSTPIAFKGTITRLDTRVAELVVDEAYAGVDTSTVQLIAPPGVDDWLGPVPWAVGTQYLVTANSAGVVMYCGRSGVATSQLQDVYDRAFGESG